MSPRLLNGCLILNLSNVTTDWRACSFRDYCRSNVRHAQDGLSLLMIWREVGVNDEEFQDVQPSLSDKHPKLA